MGDKERAGPQHKDWTEMEDGPVDGLQQNSLEEDVCLFCPQVPPTTAKVEGGSDRVSE